MKIFSGRRKRKRARDLLRLATHARHMREDVSEPTSLIAMSTCAVELSDALRRGDMSTLDTKASELEKCIGAVMPARKFPVVREYVEIFAVALGVAMTCRAYFIQPFKIPTGSMQPTLWGIHYEPCAEPDVLDELPTRAFSLRRIIWGSKYEEIKAEDGGLVALRQVGIPGVPVSDDGEFERDAAIAVIGPRGTFIQYVVAKGMLCRVEDGERIEAGTVLASGRKFHGDHVFVEKVSWNFRRPRRSEVAVFITTGIEKMGRDKWYMHYIKRLVGRPGERVEIVDPYVWINGKRVEDLMIGKIGTEPEGYTGYELPPESSGAVIHAGHPSITLGTDEYLMLGDNTDESSDGRYWGPVPQELLVGPAWVVYWPFGAHWGRIRR